MPSQNLPQPKIPGQLSNNVAAVPANSNPDPSPSLNSSPDPALNPTPLPPAPMPGNFSRENPAGLPPKLPSLQAEGPLSEPMELKADQEVEPADIQDTSPASMAVSPDASHSPNQAPVPIQATDSSPKPIQAMSVAPTTVNGQAPSTPTADQPASKVEEPIKSKFKLNIPKPALIVLGLLLVIILALLALNIFGPSKKASKTEPEVPDSAASSTSTTTPQTGGVMTLTYWGLWEDSEILKDVLADFETQERIHVDYRKQSHRDYRERLEQAIISGNGPDVFRFHATWTPMLASKLAAMPSTVMTSTEYQQTFYPIAYEQLQSNGQIVGIPLMYDGLALFYNQEMLRTANIPVPTTWSELRSAANKLTVPSNPSERNKDNITRGGLAIGNTGNVEHFADILGLLILQNGGDPADPSTQYVTDALTFYTNFIKQDEVWSDRLPSSTIAFARGEAAMMFAPSWRALEVKSLNPELDFAITQVPQLSSDKNIAWASFWAEGVNKSSKKQDAAWKLLKYLSSKEIQQKLYNSQSLVRTFGEIYSRQDLASQLSSDILLGAYLKDAPNAQAFPMASFTHDNGVNDQVIQYYASAINAVLAGTAPASALEETASGVSQVLNKYNY